MACNQAGLFLSRDTPRIVKFLSLNWLYAFTTFGFSCLHGPHQLAQKSTNTYFPLKEERDTGVPVVSGSVKSGACCDRWFFFNSFKAELFGNLAEDLFTTSLTSMLFKGFRPNCWVSRW